MVVSELPLVSVLIPSYNHAEYIEETIKSIWQQKYPKIEIIVVDDYSTDTSRAILARLKKESPLPMTLQFNSENIGPNQTLLKAFKSSKGLLILLLASDDLLAPDSLETQVQYFIENTKLKVLYGNGKVLYSGKKGGERFGKKLHGEKVQNLLDSGPADIRNYLYKNVSPLFLQCTLIARKLFSDINACDNSSLADDWLINLNIFELLTDKNQYKYTDHQVAYYRVHDNNLYKNYERQRDLKLEFVERNTPAKFKSEAFSNMHYSIAKTALGIQDRQQAWSHYTISQKYNFRLRRVLFPLKLVKLYFEAKR